MNFEEPLDLKGKTIAVLKGGPGRERKVSLRSGSAVATAVRSLGTNVVEVDVRDSRFPLPDDCFLAFNALHGTFGEDGQVQEELERRNMPFTGEGVEGSRAAFDKLVTKERFREAGIPTVEWEVLRSREESPTFDLPMVVKAPRQGSSVGVHIVREPGELPAALDDCFGLDAEVMVERFFSGREMTVGILGDMALPVVEIVPKGGFYGYENKYTKGGSEYFVPARISEEVSEQLRNTALAAHRALGLSVYSRVDIMLAENGDLNVLEINTIPGMTETSLLPKSAAAVGMSFARLCLRIAELSLRSFAERRAT